MLLASWVSLPLTLISCISSLRVSCHVRFGLPHLLLPPSGVPSITRQAGFDVGRRSTCPMNLLRLSATMSFCTIRFYWATVCKTVRPMISDHCCVCLSTLSCLSVTLAYCGQTVGWIKMPLGTEVGLRPGDIVLDENPAPSRKGAQQLPIFGPCLLLPNARPSQQLLSSCLHEGRHKDFIWSQDSPAERMTSP